MCCCFQLRRELLPAHYLFQISEPNKYLSTTIAHLSDHKWGWALHWSPDVQAEDFVFIQHMGRPVIKKVCAKQGSSHQVNSSRHGAGGSAVVIFSLHSHISVMSRLLHTQVYIRSFMNEFGLSKWSVVMQFTCMTNLVQMLGDFWSTLCISLQTQTPKYWIYTSENVMLVVYSNWAETHLGFFSTCLQSYSLVRKTSNLHLTILFNQCWNLSI